MAGHAAAGFRQFSPLDPRVKEFRGFVGAASLGYVLLGATRFAFEATRDVMYSFNPFTPYFLVTAGRLTVSQGIGGPFDLIATAGHDRLQYQGVAGLSSNGRVDRTGMVGGGRGIPPRTVPPAQADLRRHRADLERSGFPRVPPPAPVWLGHLRVVIMRTAFILGLLSLVFQAQPAPPAPKTANYVVGPQDVLTVTVFNEPQLSGRFRVENDGAFDYPFLGRIQAGGTAVAEIAALVRSKLADGYLRDPQVTVDVESFRSQNVFVMGEVRAPGKYTLTGSVTLVEALAQAGSVTPAAGSDVLILHPKSANAESPTLVESADAEVQWINLRDIQAGKLLANVTVRDGDTIFVPKAQRFFVTGYVRSPGPYPLEPNLTVLQAISMAGGLTDRGSDRRVQIIRNKKQSDAKLTDIVQADDTIVVRQRLM